MDTEPKTSLEEHLRAYQRPMNKRNHGDVTCCAYCTTTQKNTNLMAKQVKELTETVAKLEPLTQLIPLIKNLELQIAQLTNQPTTNTEHHGQQPPQHQPQQQTNNQVPAQQTPVTHLGEQAQQQKPQKPQNRRPKEHKGVWSPISHPTDTTTSQSNQNMINTPKEQPQTQTPSKEQSWSKVTSKKRTATAHRNWLIGTKQPETKKVPENIEKWTELVSQKEEATPIYIEMASKPFAPVKEWLRKGCQIPATAIIGMSWVNGLTLELITTTTSRDPVISALKTAKAHIMSQPPKTDPEKEVHRLITIRARSKSELANRYYSATIKELSPQLPKNGSTTTTTASIPNKKPDVDMSE